MEAAGPPVELRAAGPAGRRRPECSLCTTIGQAGAEPAGRAESTASTSTSEADTLQEELLKGWRRPVSELSLPEVNQSVAVPGEGGAWYRKCFAFAGMGFVISVGYMDPGNWATDISAGSAYGYKLLLVVLLSSAAAMFLQALALKLGVVADRDLAQACRDAYPRAVNWVLWVVMEVAVAATDLAEVIGSATALYLLFGLPLWAGVLVTAVDVLFILAFGMHNFRVLELIIFGLVAVIAGCFAYELAAAKPVWLDVARGLIPRAELLTDPGILYNAIGILGATVMPHNLFLHSSIVQTRAYARTPAGRRMAVWYGTWDSCLSLASAFFINAAILILAAAAFHFGRKPQQNVAYISDAYQLLTPAVGQNAARILFGIALLASGQNSTITGTLAGQIVMEGFIKVKLKPWVRRLVTRLVAIIPAIVIAAVSGNAGAGRLLVLSQVILSLALPFAVAPLVHFTSSRPKMGGHANGWAMTIVAVVLTLIISALNAYLIVVAIRDNEFAQTTGV